MILTPIYTYTLTKLQNYLCGGDWSWKGGRNVRTKQITNTSQTNQMICYLYLLVRTQIYFNDTHENFPRRYGMRSWGLVVLHTSKWRSLLIIGLLEELFESVTKFTSVADNVTHDGKNNGVLNSTYTWAREEFGLTDEVS